MHKLERSIAPDCLSKYKHGENKWNDVTPVEKSEIWQRLDSMQQKRCAYCEKRIKTTPENKNAHIEHFRQRSRYPQGTFSWKNLFASCNRNNSCGNHKNSCGAYNHQDLIKPDQEKPENFFLFIADGTISLLPNLSSQDQHRAKETLRILNLDAKNGSLRQMRKAAVQGYLQTAEYFMELAAEFTEEEWRPLLEVELNSIKNLPFATAIKHLLLMSY